MSMEIIAPLSGKITQIHIEPGAAVEEDEEVLVIEAMKMETPVYSPCDGTIVEVLVNAGDDVEEDDVLAVVNGEK
jgi:acetyl-CoA carboxylase biotin carboxyl carrier protein